MPNRCRDRHSTGLHALFGYVRVNPVFGVNQVFGLSCVKELAGFDLDRAGLSTCTFRLDGDLGQVESDDPVERGERFGA